jgi:integrative and conjugative element protein (TIGR02256 family)
MPDLQGPWGLVRLPRRCVVLPAVVLVTCEESQRAAPRETGGILIGRNEEDHLLVECASLPGPKARHSRSGFRRDGEYTQTILDDIFSSSSGASNYLGEWHSHPTGLGRPSPRDLRSIMWIADDNAYATPEPVLGLSAKEPGGWRLSLYVWQRGQLWLMDQVQHSD